MIKVLITEDSPVVRGYLKYILGQDPDIQVVGTAQDGEEAVRMVEMHKPDVVTMDIHMPKMDGFEATRRIMESNPVPIVIVSASWNPEEVDKTFRTMEAGAVAALEKPRGMGHPNSESSVKELLQTVKLMSEVKVVRRWSKYKTAKPGAPEPPSPSAEPGIRARPDTQLVAVGASTGGPMVLQTLLASLPKDFPLPVVIVQHIALGFLAGLRDWLGRSASMPVHIAEDKQQLVNSHIYLAPDGFQMGIDRYRKVTLQKDVPGYTLCPSVSYMFKSVAESFGDRAIGVLLTGMGRDGAEEMRLMKEKGALTVAQDKESSVVHGMPGEAIRLGGATFILPPEKIAGKLVDLASGARREGK
ncbi:chemotaxis-specific protein-glutamate methyltransferase CheB [bacterium]|nr:chemotaxis-specific protein-glutamate methyltransferase CheB [bacterium]